MSYGIPFKGSKSKIAKDILDKLPEGNRLVDLFGGGFAITHCAMMEYPHKWQRFYYNDINPLLPPLIEKAISGYYNYDNFTADWISRDDFYNLKDIDGYVKWVWSFGNNGNDYLYSKEIEPYKRAVHKAVASEDYSEIDRYGFDYGGLIGIKGIHNRRTKWLEIVKNSEGIVKRGSHYYKDGKDIEQLQQLQQLELHSHDYREYQYQQGDVVYCDIPYEDALNKRDYGGGFDHKAFFKWAAEQPYDVYYSSYTKGTVMWQKTVTSVMNSGDGRVKRNETLLVI